MLQNLTLEQAPPVSVPFRFFAVAPWFGVAAALLIIVTGPELLNSRWSTRSLAVTHLLTLGFMSFVMCGAMMQMLPVLAGTAVPQVLIVSSFVHILLLFGTLALTGGFLFISPFLMGSGALLLGAGYVLFITALLIALTRKHTSNHTISAMHYALSALLITVVLGLALVTALATQNHQVNLIPLTNIHLSWGILGWTGLLVCGVAYQVVPMFQMTPHYPEWLTRKLVFVLFSGLLVWSGLVYFGEHNGTGLADLWTLVFVVGYGVFAVVTIHLQRQRRRRTEDITRNFWMVGMASILAASTLWVIELFGDVSIPNFPFLLGTLLIPGFAVSVTNGMLYRIVPFLIWFHLQHRHIASAPGSDFPVPNVKKIIPMDRMKWQFGFHLAALLLLVIATISPGLFLYPAGTVLMISFVLLSRNLITSMMLFRSCNLLLEEKIRGGT